MRMEDTCFSQLWLSGAGSGPTADLGDFELRPTGAGPLASGTPAPSPFFGLNLGGLTV